jgi:pre-mRNA-splicing factor SYF1
LKLLRRATAPPPSRTHFFDDSEPVQRRVYKSLKLWSLYADVEESFGQLSTCRAVYERVLDLRIATPQIVINYAMFLEDNQYFEDAFKACVCEIRAAIPGFRHTRKASPCSNGRSCSTFGICT